jgi:hypothetical protein
MILNLVCSYCLNINTCKIIQVQNLNGILQVYFEEKKVSRVDTKIKTVEDIISVFIALYWSFVNLIFVLFIRALNITIIYFLNNF